MLKKLEHGKTLTTKIHGQGTRGGDGAEEALRGPRAPELACASCRARLGGAALALCCGLRLSDYHPAQWLERDAAAGSLSVVCGSLREASGRIAKRIVVLVPGAEVVLTEATLPPGNRKLAFQSIPSFISA